eukprot:647740-Rhodomonas_salina.4
MSKKRYQPTYLLCELRTEPAFARGSLVLNYGMQVPKDSKAKGLVAIIQSRSIARYLPTYLSTYLPMPPLRHLRYQPRVCQIPPYACLALT